MKNRIGYGGVVAAIGAASLMTSISALGLGFRNPDQDARATGQGEAFVAQADDASAIYYNPAGLTQFKGTEVTSGAYIDFPNIHFHPSGGGDFHPDNQVVFLPHLYAASDLGLEKWRFGLGFNVPFGNSIDWGSSSPFPEVVIKSALAVYNIQPTVAYQFNEHFSLGAGLNVYQANTSLERDLPILFGGGRFRFHGDGDGYGATAGLLWKINPQHSVGVVYRSPFSINFDGSTSVKGNLGGLDGTSSANTRLQFPQSVAAGYAFRPVPKLKLEIDVEWTDWNTLNAPPLHSANPAFNGTPTVFNWQDSFYYEFGAQYTLNEHWVVRAGYIYSENSVPSKTFSPVLPDSNRHVLSVGLGYALTRLNVDVVYQYSLSEDRTVSGSMNSPAVDGTWKSDGHAVMVTSTLKF